MQRQSATRHRSLAFCPSAVSTTPSVFQGCSGHRQIGWRPLAVVHDLAFSKAGGELEALQDSSVKRAGHVHQAEYRHTTQREFRHAKVKHPAAKQGLLLLIGCFFSHQPNFAVKPTPTAFSRWFPACCALRCGLPVALGFEGMPS